MFERFTDRARRVLVYAQQEALLLNHNYIGSEHILLGLIHVDGGVAAVALERMGISLDAVREKVEEVVGVFETRPTGSPPFTTRAKKILELSLREAIRLGHNYISTEHILLGLLNEGEGVAARVLVSLGAGLDETRETVLGLLSDQPREDEPEARHFTPSGRRVPQPLRPGSWAVGIRKAGSIVACSFCGRQPPDTGQLIAGRDACICEHCIRQWSSGLERDEGSDES